MWGGTLEYHFIARLSPQQHMTAEIDRFQNVDLPVIFRPFRYIKPKTFTLKCFKRKGFGMGGIFAMMTSQFINRIFLAIGYFRYHHLLGGCYFWQCDIG